MGAIMWFAVKDARIALKQPIAWIVTRVRTLWSAPVVYRVITSFSVKTAQNVSIASGVLAWCARNSTF